MASWTWTSRGRRSSLSNPETMASTGVKGVRSSWLKVARKWSLAWLAASAAAAAFCPVRSVTTRQSAGPSSRERAVTAT